MEKKSSHIPVHLNEGRKLKTFLESYHNLLFLYHKIELYIFIHFMQLLFLDIPCLVRWLKSDLCNGDWSTDICTLFLHEDFCTGRDEKNSSTSRQYIHWLPSIFWLLSILFDHLFVSKNFHCLTEVDDKIFRESQQTNNNKKIRKTQQNCIKVTFKIERIQWNASNLEILFYFPFLSFIKFKIEIFFGDFVVCMYLLFYINIKSEKHFHCMIRY